MKWMGKSLRFGIMLAVLLMCAACAAKKNTADNSDYADGNKAKYDQEQANGASSPEMQEGAGDASTGIAEGSQGAEIEEKTESTKTNVSTNRKLIRRITMESETLEFDSTLELIMKQVESTGGYVENSSLEGDGFEGSAEKYASLILRIPSNQVDAFIASVDDKVNVLQKQESTQDVTLDYVDTQSHIKALKIEQERLLVLLEKAKKLEDIIALEERLSSVRYEIEKYNSTLRTYDNLIEYTTVTINLHEVVRITPVKEKNALSKMGTGFKETLFNIRDGFVSFIVWFVVNLPYFIVWGGIFAILGLILFKANKKYKAWIQKTPSEETKEKDKVTNDKIKS